VHNMNHGARFAAASLASMIAFILMQPAQAADAPGAVAPGAVAPASSTSLEEVVVTANKRGEQSIQDAPAAIQALSGDDLQKSGVVNFADYAGKIPSLSFTDLGPGDKKYVIRGVTSRGPATVGVYYDETVITAQNAGDGGGRNADIALYDLDRIEVLKGPQGTLYGASSMSGTIRYITKKPVLDKFEGYVATDVSTTSKGGTNHGFNGAINLPLVDDKLALRAVGWYVKNSGFIDYVRIPAGPIKDANDDVTKGGRVTLRWQATDNLNILATATLQNLDAGGSSRYTPPGASSFGDAGAGFPPVPGGDLVNTDLALSPWHEKIKIAGITAELNALSGTFTATANHFDRKIDYAFDSSPILFFFGVPIPGVTLQPQERRINSAEVRYASKFDGPVNFVAGAFVQDEKNDFRVEVIKTNAAGLPNGPFSPLDSDDALTNPNGNTFFGRFDNNKIKQYAGFGELTWNITDKFTAVGGVRYFHSKQDSTQDTTHPFGGFGTNIPVGPQSPPPRKDTKTTFKLNLSYKFDPKMLVYATASEGFRVGGTNSADLPFVSGDIPPGFGPDTLWNYEIGEKSEFLDGKLRFNVAAYEIRWSDIQVQSTDKTGAFLFTTNAGTGKVDGIEIEASAVLAPGLVLDFGGAYTKARLTSDPPPVPVSDPNFARSGDRFPGVPQTQFSAALTYSVPVAADANLSVRADLTHRGGTNTQFNTGSKFAVPLDSYDLVNLRASIDWRNWQFSAFAKNLFDKRAEVDAISSDQDPLARITVRPRTLGAGVSVKF
jgi:iron complex outermembrane recepter protein